MRIKTRIISRGGIILKERPWQKNLILDQGLNGFAKISSPVNATPANSFLQCHVGSGTNPTAIASGAITFTQSGTTITASGNFFTSAMVGAIIKYGTGSGGLEQYISAFTDATHVTVTTSNSQSAIVGTVWMVQQTQLQTQSFTTSTYQTTGTSCQTVFNAGGSVLMQRTFNFAIQASPYTVNEIGWSPDGNATHLFGRIVLPSSDVVGTSNFYQVVMQLTMTYLPASPTAIGNLGTNFDTTGNAALESEDYISFVNSDGTTFTDALRVMDSSHGFVVGFSTATYTQNSAPAHSSALSWGTNKVINGAGTWAYVSGGLPGIMQGDTGVATVSTSGQTCYGFGIMASGDNHPLFDIKLTTPIVLPNGTFNTRTIFQCQYSRSLTN